MTRDPLDLDIEQFNPKLSRLRYEALGYSQSFIEKLLIMDELIYACEPEEIREALDDADD
jgi:hypothetical protein